MVIGTYAVVDGGFEHVSNTRDTVLGQALKEYEPSAKLVPGTAQEVNDGEAFTAQAVFGDDVRDCTFPVGRTPVCT